MASEIFGNINNKTTLARSPFLSRFTEFESTEENYIFIGFTPGLPLQAAELNELQDNFHKISTLNAILISNWTIYCLKNGIENLENVESILWNGVVPLSPSMISINDSNINCSSGWYYITDPSGIKYWIYLSQSFTVSSLNAPTGFVSFTITNSDIFASSNPATGDERLFDNSAGFPNTNSPGSFRVKRDISSIQFIAGDIGFSMISKINNTFSWLNGIKI
jgi:hypothetical protein